MSDAPHWLTLLPGLCAVLVTASACPLIDDPNHCANKPQDPEPCSTALEVCDPCTPSSQTPNKDGCMARNEAVDKDPAEGCQLVAGGTGTDATDGTTTGSSGMDTTVTTTVDPDTTESVGDTETTTGPPQPCMDDDECMDAGKPFCSPVLQECVSCTGMPEPHVACENKDPALPACNAGVCVQCTAAAAGACDDETPICDQDSNTCVACTEHAQCGMAACNLFTGACLPSDGPNDILRVGPGQPFTTLNAAVASVGPGSEATIIVHDATYDEAVTIAGGRVVAFLAADGADPSWQVPLAANASQLVVSGTSTVLMDGIQLRGNLSGAVPGLRVDGALAWLDRGQLMQNTGTAVRVENAAQLVLRNSLLGAPTDVHVLSVQASTVDIIYSTLAAGFGDSVAVSCDAGSVVTVRNSIAVARDAGVIDCAPLTATYTATSETVPGTGNDDVGVAMTSWFVGYATDLHLTPAGAGMFDGIAQWNDVAREPLVDIDGQPRVEVAGAMEHAGADLP